MNPEQRQAVVKERMSRGFPWHRPPHPEAPGKYRIISAACFEHQKFFYSETRLARFERELLGALKDLDCECAAWCVLPNHYHVLVRIADMKSFGRGIGQLHGRTSFELNCEDDARGRTVWYDYEDRCMRSEAHFYTSLNYIHNP